MQHLKLSENSLQSSKILPFHQHFHLRIGLLGYWVAVQYYNVCWNDIMMHKMGGNFSDNIVRQELWSVWKPCEACELSIDRRGYCTKIMDML